MLRNRAVDILIVRHPLLFCRSGCMKDGWEPDLLGSVVGKATMALKGEAVESSTI